MTSSSEVTYTVRVNARAKSLRLTVHPDSRIVVTMPKYFPRERVGEFVQNNLAWIANQLSKLAKREETDPHRLPKSSRRDYERYKERARALVKAKIAQFGTASPPRGLVANGQAAVFKPVKAVELGNLRLD